MARPNNSTTRLGDVPVHYARYADQRYSYGTRGKPYTFYCLSEFETKLDNCFKEIWQVCPLGPAEVITSAGAYVNKSGAHGLGRGFDLDALFWADHTLVTLHYPQNRSFYLGVEAVLRKHFGTVLNYEYNSAHRDHFHIDDLSEVRFSVGSKSRVLFLQMVISHVFGNPIGIDGQFGQETGDAARDLLMSLGLGTASKLGTTKEIERCLNRNWITFLDTAAESAFQFLKGQRAEVPSPAELLHDVYKTIQAELGQSQGRKTIETTLTAFAEHPETVAWLAQWDQTD